MDEFLHEAEAKIFRSGLGICFYISKERCDTQHPVRIFATYMSRPTRTSMNAIKKLASYLIHTSDMKFFYGTAELYQTTMQN